MEYKLVAYPKNPNEFYTVFIPTLASEYPMDYKDELILQLDEQISSLKAILNDIAPKGVILCAACNNKWITVLDEEDVDCICNSCHEGMTDEA